MISRIIDGTLAMPIILVALLFAVIVGPGLLNLVVAISLLMWARFARVIRSEVLTIKAQDFIRRAQVTGCSSVRIMFRHILPNVLNTVIVLAAIQIGWVIIAESSLSFLGIGIPPPTPSWGSMVAEGRDHLRTAWWLAALPGACITVTVAAVIVFGDWLRDRLDPSLRNV
jgi:peptide/nickel transport system permease protein